MPSPAYQLIETDSFYTVVIYTLGFDSRSIGLEVNEEKREVTVLARRERELVRGGFYWIFNVPTNALLCALSVQFQPGIFEVLIPKRVSA